MQNRCAFSLSLSILITALYPLNTFALDWPVSYEWRDITSYNGLTAQVPENEWCAEQIGIRVVASEVSAYRGSLAHLEALMDRARGTIRNECSKAKRAVIRGIVNDAPSLIDDATAYIGRYKLRNDGGFGYRQRVEPQEKITSCGEEETYRPHYAAHRDNVALMRCIKRDGGSIEWKTDHGETPLHSAAESGSALVAKFLLEEGLDPTSRANDGETPLHYAASSSSLRVVKLFLDYGVVDVDPRDDKGQTPLHHAAKWGQPQVVELLIQNSADVSATDTYAAATPLHYAAKGTNSSNRTRDQGYPEVTQLLLNHGADLNAMSELFGTPLYMASVHDNPEVSDVLSNAEEVALACDQQGNPAGRTARADEGADEGGNESCRKMASSDENDSPSKKPDWAEELDEATAEYDESESEASEGRVSSIPFEELEPVASSRVGEPYHSHESGFYFCNEGEQPLEIAYATTKIGKDYDFTKVRYQVSGWHEVGSSSCLNLEWAIHVAVVKIDEGGDRKLAPYAGVERSREDGYGVLGTTLAGDSTPQYCIPPHSNFRREIRFDFDDIQDVAAWTPKEGETVQKCQSESDTKIPFALDLDWSDARSTGFFGTPCEIELFQLTANGERLQEVKVKGDQLYECG